ncbi:MFS transporter [Microvirga zambiensis]|uniref:MFS transporter n=1 Tax=Microvirga zambiensis TaxID=1402137 RepID=UPI00191DAF9B|nr:MFS transporter [Microvirga zambiensis]
MRDVAGSVEAPVQIERSLDALNFFLADVRDGLGPYLAVYLLTIRHWNEAEIGLVMTLAGLAALLTQTPAGALIDATHAKRGVIATAAVVVTAGSLLLPFLSSFWPVAMSQAVVHATGSVFAPAIAAITLGIVGHAQFARRTGRNEAFNHAGNAFAAAAAGGAAYVWGPIVVFFLMAAMALASLIGVLMVPTHAINHEQARGFRDGRIAVDDQPSGLKILLTCRPLLIFAACAVLFHFANAAMLPLVGQKLALQDKNLGTSLMSACIVAAQVIMVPMAMLVARKADTWGRKPLFLAGFLILPIRGVLYTLSDNPYWLVAVQMLDGIGAGLYGALFPLIVADLMEGTGRFNVAQGAVTTAQGIGASLSTTLAGILVVKAGYSAAFLVLAGIAGAGLLLFWAMMPETKGFAPGVTSGVVSHEVQAIPGRAR